MFEMTLVSTLISSSYSLVDTGIVFFMLRCYVHLTFRDVAYVRREHSGPRADEKDGTVTVWHRSGFDGNIVRHFCHV